MASGLWINPSSLGGTYASDEMALEACRMASFILWAWTGRKYSSVETATETYECACSAASRRPDTYMPASLGVYPLLENGVVTNAAVNTDCGCFGTSNGRHVRLRLRNRPVRRVNFVRRGSETLDPGEYSVQNSGLLTLRSGSPNDVCGLTVSYSYGVGIPGGGRLAAKLLAEEFLKSWNGDDDCRLPDRVTNVSRQGVSFSIIDRQEFIDDLRTGILEVDMFLRAVNPQRALKKAKVFSPDLPKPYSTTANFSPAEIGAQNQARKYDLVLTPGQLAEYGFRLYGQTGESIELGSYVWQASITRTPDPDSEVLVDLTSSMALNGTDPKLLELKLEDTDTSLLTPGRYYWSAYLSGKPWLEGQVLVT